MKKRIISPDYIKNAYEKEETSSFSIKEDVKKSEKVTIPREMTALVGQVINFIEYTNKIEGENNEDK